MILILITVGRFRFHRPSKRARPELQVDESLAVPLFSEEETPRVGVGVGGEKRLGWEIGIGLVWF